MNNVTLTFVRKIDGVIVNELPPVLLTFQVGARGIDAILPDGIIIDPEYVHTDNNFTDELVTEIGTITDKQNITDNSLNTTSKTVVGALNELKSRVDELPDALSFDNYSDFVNDFNAILAGVYNIGQSVLIAAMNVPDIWVYQTSTFQEYTYTTDAQLITDLGTGVHIGYYVFQPLETEKVNLSNYYTKSQIDGFLANYYTSTQIDTFLAGKQATITPTADTTPVDTDYYIFQRLGVWFKVLYSDLKTNLALTFGKLSTVNVWNLLQTFTSGVKTGKIQPIADSTTAIQLMKADGVTPIVIIDTTNEKIIFNGNASVGAFEIDIVSSGVWLKPTGTGNSGNKELVLFGQGSGKINFASQMCGYGGSAIQSSGIIPFLSNVSDLGENSALKWRDLWLSRDIHIGQLKLNALNTTPTSSTDTGVLGEVRFDANYMYLCVATNTWKRTALTTW